MSTYTFGHSLELLSQLQKKSVLGHVEVYICPLNAQILHRMI